jgi:MFS family permease
VSSIAELLVPARLGDRFRRLVASSWVTNLGDGMALAAGPLLVASQTHDPFRVALAGLLQRLPFLVFGLFAGVVADRVNRRTVVVVGDALRVVVLLSLGLMVATDHVSVGAVLVVMFLLGTAETFVDTTSSTLLPMLVENKADYGVANARLMAGYITANQLVGPPLGAFLFAAGMWLPFVSQAVLVGLGAWLVAQIAIAGPPRGGVAGRLPVRQDIAEGVRWLWSHPPMRTLALTIVTFNVTWMASWAVLVLYATVRLDMGEVGFGLLTTASAVGGLLGTGVYGWLEARIGIATMMKVGLVFETFSHAALAVTTVDLVALVIFFVFGAHAFIWGTTSHSVRQRAVPTEFQGRVGSVYMLGVVGGMVIGGFLGGVIAQQWGIVAPFWFGFAGSAVILVLIWPQLDHIAHADEIPGSGAADGYPERR